ncbi:MAG TPA: glycosyltransferase family 1 protein [Candidatus Moranbacteria bacterium]|nr:glycosyltransferase family 1 protein [Candidatus Moranbacteria bacterium]
MRIGIDGSRAFLGNRTGIEEYSYQTIKHLAYGQAGLRDELKGQQVVLYVRKRQLPDFVLPSGWSIKSIGWPRFWTQLGLSWEMLLHPVDALFVPAHTVPFIHPQKTIVTIHGLEYEFVPQAYSLWERIYMRWSIKNSCRWAQKIVSVSENTKKDLRELYEVQESKITVVGEGFSDNLEFGISNSESNHDDIVSKIEKFKIQNSKFFLFVGRIEGRKNIGNIIRAFEILKEKKGILHKLVLAGRPGHGYQDIRSQIANCKYKEDIWELGYVGEEEKWALLKKAEVFVFPTLYEGFGIPLLEAQSVGCPVVAANNSSIPEVAGGGALLVDAQSPEEIAKAVYEIVSDENLRRDLADRGRQNVKRFSWEKCAGEIAKILAS